MGLNVNLNVERSALWLSARSCCRGKAGETLERLGATVRRAWCAWRRSDLGWLRLAPLQRRRHASGRAQRLGAFRLIANHDKGVSWACGLRPKERVHLVSGVLHAAKLASAAGFLISLLPMNWLVDGRLPRRQLLNQ